MKMIKKAMCVVLAFVMVISILPAMTFPAIASTPDADMDALTALGIDTSEVPEGYDANSLENPYGKNTVEISPVHELYSVGLSSAINYGASYDTTSTALQNGGNTESHATSAGNSLNSVLYGNEKWSTTTVSGMLGAGDSSTVMIGSSNASGTTTATGSYTLVTSGTVNSTDTSFATKGYLKAATNASTDLGSSFVFGLSTVASGNFDGNTSGLSAQTAMVYTSDYSANGGLSLRFGNAENGTYGSAAKVLLGTTKKIGNPELTYGGKLVENFAENPYQLQNYLQVTTGDWNSDGLDEVAVYIPEQGNSRIVVYALQLTSADDKTTAYLDAAKWSVVWTYYLHEGDVVSNMVSLVSGDVNQDGKDDLAATWGYYYGPTQNVGSTAVVMFGAPGTDMLKDAQEFDLTYAASNIVRAAFTFGNMAGSDTDTLILCGQSDADLKTGNTQTRYVALYSWDGLAFTSNVYQNFDLFDKDGDNYIWSAMMTHNDKFYSIPLSTANAATISQGVSGGGDLLYFDSLIIEYTESGLDIKEAWDNTTAMQQNTASLVEYVEYGAVAGDLTGQTGAGAIITMTQTLSSRANATATYTVAGSHWEPVYSWAYYYQNWFYDFFDIRTWYTYISGYTSVADSSAVSVGYSQLTMGNTYMVAVDPSVNYIKRTQADFSTSICLANTDSDSSYMSYGGKHYYTYTDPEVLSVLASPPYFSDLINRDDLSGSYAESTTSYSSTSGSGAGYNLSATITVGAYVAFEQDIQVFGVTVASVEAEAQITAAFTFETETESTLEQTVTYSATAGEDMVAFYSIPMEIYEYTSYVPDGNGGYKEVLTTVNIPHEASVRLLSLAEYESIAEDYSVLPKIADTVLTHVVGDPSSYPSATDGYSVIAKYSDTPSAVGFSSTEGGSGISQEIAMSKTTSTSFSASAAVEAKAGAGAGGFKVGVIAGAEVGAGLVKISTDGSSFSGDMQNMPIEAQPYGYGMNWRIFCYKYSDGNASFPVVSYIVSDIHNPSSLPDDFEQDIAATTSDAITLKWSYDKTVAGFKLFRYYEFPDGSGSYEIAYVPFTSAESYDDTTGTYYFEYEDNNNGQGLSPYTEYQYQIKTVRATNPKESIYSEPMSCRTKTEVGYPTMSISGLDEYGRLPIYPDASSTVTLSVAAASSYNGLSYQWQKLVNGVWGDVSGKTSASLTISNAGAADKGTYRCRVNAIYYDTGAAQNYYISAYSDGITTVYSKRTPTTSIFTAAENVTTAPGGATLEGLISNIELYSANANHSTAPTGNVTFTVKGTDYEYSETVALAASSATKFLGGAEKYYSTASLSIDSLPEGVYTVTAYYGGSRVFKDMETPTGILVVVGEGSAYNLSLSETNGGSSVTNTEFGQNVFAKLVSISKDVDGTILLETVPSVTYKLLASGSDTPVAFTSGSVTPNVGSYTIQAYIGAEVVAAASQEITVSKKPVTISVENKTNVSAAAVESTPPVIVSSDLSSEALAALNLTYTAVNSAGNAVSLTNDTDPGNYIVTACSSSTTPVTLYNNYSITFVSGTYTIIGATYRLTAVAENYTDQAGTRPVGTVGISNTSQLYADYSSGTAVLLYATPQAGYQIDTWTALYENATTKTQQGGSTFTLTTEAQKVTVTVTFKPATITLATVSQPGSGGTVTCADEYFSSGAYVSYGAEYSFTATPAAGYHFSKWTTVSGGATMTLNGTAGTDGTNTLAVTVGTTSMTVFATFVRDAYTLTLNGNITAYYMYDDDENSTTALVQKKIVSGSSVAGDTEITVEPKTGYQAAEDAYFIVNGATTADSVSHVFNLTQNTTVALNTVRNSYAVTLSASNGTVATTVAGVTATSEDLAAVEGGLALTFTAHANRGYVFDHWTLNGADVVNSTKTLSIPELGGNAAVVAVFVANTAYTAQAAVSATTRGTMQYTLYDIYDDLVGTENTVMPEGGLTVYKGESITLTVSVNSGSTIEQWNVNNVNTYTTQKTYTIDNIGANIEATAYLKAASSYLVNFVAMGLTGSTLAAQADGTAISTGTLQYGGSALVFSATPAGGYMLDYWTVTNGGLAVSESSAMQDSAGKTVIVPTYTINPLKQNVTVRAHYIALSTSNVTLPAASVMGDSVITYVTPILPTDDGTRELTAESVRSGGLVRMTFEPNSGYGTSVATLEAAVEADVNDDATVLVELNAGKYYVTVSNLTQDITLIESDIYYSVYSVTVPTGVTASSVIAAEDDIITLTVTPAYGYTLSTLALDNGTLNEAVSPAKLTYTFSMPATDVIVSASFTYTPPGGGGGTTDSEEQNVPASGNGTSISIPVTITGGIAEMDISSEMMADLISPLGTVVLDLSSLEDVTGVVIPAAAFSEMSGASGIETLTVSLPEASLSFDSDALEAINAAGHGDVTLTADMVVADTLTAAQQEIVGDRPVINITLMIGNETVTNFGLGSVEVKVPYVLGTGEDPNAIVIWYLNNEGILESVTAQYDADTGSVVFVTNHFSTYVIGALPFVDLDRSKWYFDSVSFAYANGLFSGTSATIFEPETSMTRAMLVTVLWRMENEPTAQKASMFTDVKAGSWYYEAVSWAAENGIVAGYGNGLFGTEDSVSREQIAVILMNYAKYKGYDVSASSNLSSYTDSNKISSWAETALQWAGAEDLISGIGNNTLNPIGHAERCQVAAILQRFMENIVK